jgi:hypothetical protein
MKALLACFLAAPIIVAAQVLPSFPPDAVVPTPEQITAAVANKVFKGKRASDGIEGQFEYRADGNSLVIYPSINEFGPWKAELGKICVEDPRNGPACNEVRLKDGVIYYRRNRNGEVFPLLPK